MSDLTPSPDRKRKAAGAADAVLEAADAASNGSIVVSDAPTSPPKRQQLESKVIEGELPMSYISEETSTALSSLKRDNSFDFRMLYHRSFSPLSSSTSDACMQCTRVVMIPSTVLITWSWLAVWFER